MRRVTDTGRPISPLLSGLVVAGIALALVAAETRRPLRRQKQARLGRNLRNAGVAAVAGLTVAVVQTPAIGPLTRLVERRRFGLLKRLDLPPALEIALGVVLMDYTLYLWHVLTHRVPVLWRAHQPHHADLDMDASTALRFHAVELAASVPYRAVQVMLIGVGPRAFSVWQTFTLGAILFHHSNVRLSPRLERLVEAVLVTPRLHGIHHSMVEGEANSNWSSGLSVWDRLHGTYRRDVDPGEVEIGVPAFRDPADVTIGRIAAMPFAPQPPSWRLPDGTRPIRQARGRAASADRPRDAPEPPRPYDV